MKDERRRTSLFHLCGIGLILVGLALVCAVFSEATDSPASVSTEPIVLLPPEPMLVWPRPLLQVSSSPLEETETRGGEEGEAILLLPPRHLASAPLLEGQERVKVVEHSPSPPLLIASLGAEPTSPEWGVGDEVSPLLGWPVSGEITQGFGCSPYYTGLPGPGCPADAPWFHDGLDIGAVPGAPVRAALTGTVLFAGPDGSGPVCNEGYRGYGLAVVVNNGAGWQAMYAHLSQVQVVAGQAVTPETLIGRVGATGCVSGAHLHFGLRYQGDLVDPLLDGN